MAQLLASAGYQKPSYVRSFIKLLDRIGKHLKYAPEIPCALGLSLLQKIEVEPVLIDILREDLGRWDDRSEAEELSILRRIAGAGEEGAVPMTPAPTRLAKLAAALGKAKTSPDPPARGGREMHRRQRPP